MLKRKDRILISAIELLDAEGVKGLTTKSLAKKQKVTEPALYRQYKGKQDILIHIVEEYSTYDFRIINTIIEAGLKGMKAIDFYVRRFSELYQNYQELTTVMFSMDLFMYHEVTSDKMKETISTRLQFLENIVEQSKPEFVKQQNMTAQEIAGLIDGVIYSQVYVWRMSEKSYDLNEKLPDYLMKILTD